MEKMRMESIDMTAQNIDKIAALFPNCITETVGENGDLKKAINFDLLRQMLSGDVIEGDEAYEFTWVGKKASIVEANKPIRKTLRPCKEESVNWDTTENLYIEGDNLDVLKLLQESYLGKVKMIYIDPPYNTGSDFIYRDNFSVGVSDYEMELGVTGDDGNRLFKNTDTNGRFHSDWCSMMYSRLMLARNLLSDDGVIFISIDDNEIENLQKIAREIFGDNNIEVLIWNKEAEGSSGTLKQVSTTRRIHEYIVCACKNKKHTQYHKIHEAIKGREGEFQTANLAVNAEKENKNHPNYFTIRNPFGEHFTKQWKWNKNEIKRLIDENLIYWGSDGHKQPRLIIPTDERRTTYLLSILNYGGTTIGRKDFENLFAENIEFSYPKPIILMKKILGTVMGENEIVLDFFSGSATTAHAVMQMNSEDNGHRKFIMVQLPEETDEKSEAYKAGYKNICEIGKERIRRAGRKIVEENKDKEGIENLDIGFRVFKLDDSNTNDVYYSPAEYSQNLLSMLESNVKSDRSDLDLLFGCLLEWGLPLSMPYTSEQIEGCTVHTYNDGDLIACFDENIPDAVIKEIANRQPLRAVFRDSSFNGSPAKINVGEIFKMLAPDTKVKVI